MRFIDFQRGPPLECVELGSAVEYEAFVPKGMVPYSPGINLVVPPESPKTLEDFAEAFVELRPYHLHVNYDGSSDPGKPGWNYLNFEVPPVRGIFVWLTQRDEAGPVIEHRVNHANGAIRLRGLLLGLETPELATLAELVGGRVSRGVLEVGGLPLWTPGAVKDAPVIPGKRFPLVAAVVETNRLTARTPGAEGVRSVSFLSRPAARISTSPLSWDLLLTAA